MSGRGRLWLFLLLAGAALPACVPNVPATIRLGEVPLPSEPTGLVLFADGLNLDTLVALQRAGRLPNITRYLIDRGVTVLAALTSLPTITHANGVSYVTGLLPGHHQVVGNRWFDRYRLILQDYGSIRTYRQVNADFVPPTIYEVLGEDFTATILTPVHRGATRNIDNWTSAGVAWFFGLQGVINRLTTQRLELISDLASRTGRWPKLIFAYFSSADTVGHVHGAGSRQYTDIILDLDDQVGHVCQALERAGLLERTFITLVSDHGMVETTRHLDLGRHFRQVLRLPVRTECFGRDLAFEDRQAHFAASRVVLTVDGSRHCAVHLRAGEYWWQRPSEEEIDAFAARFAPDRTGVAGGGAQGPGERTLPERLADLPATELVVVRRSSGSVRVQNSSGLAVIQRAAGAGGKTYRYTVVRGTDPLGYASDSKAGALLDGQFHDAGAWLTATARTAYPDAAVQLVEMGDSPRSGDVWLFARVGWDFGGNHRGGHGGLSPRETIVPWLWAGPDLPAGAAIEGARTVDLMPTLLDLLGRAEAIPAGLDGRSLADRLRQAPRAPPATNPAAGRTVVSSSRP